jgi:hypothetical protein
MLSLAARAENTSNAVFVLLKAASAKDFNIEIGGRGEY